MEYVASCSKNNVMDMKMKCRHDALPEKCPFCTKFPFVVAPPKNSLRPMIGLATDPLVNYNINWFIENCLRQE